MPARGALRRHRRHAAVLCLVLALSVVSLPGCIRETPLLAPQVAEELQRADTLVPAEQSTTPAVPLEQASIDPNEVVLDEARRAGAVPPPPDSLELTLADYLAQVLRHNLDIQVELYNPATARQSYAAARAKFESLFEYAFNRNESVSAFGQATKTTMFEPSVTVPLRTGGFGIVSLPLSELDIDGLPNSYTDALDISISQPLLRNAGLQVNRATIELAGLRMRQTDARTKLSIIRILANAEKAYWFHYASHRDLQVQLEQYETATQQVYMSNRLVEEGVRSQAEITRAEAGAARRFEAIILSETSRRRTERELKRTMNRPDVPIDSPTTIVPVSEPEPLGLRLDRQRLMALALANRMDLLDNEIQMAADRITVDLERNRKLPGLDLNFNYSFSGTRSSFDSALDNIFGRDEDSWFLGLSASFPLGNRAAQARYRDALLRRAQTRDARQRLELAIRQDVLDAADALEQDWERVLASRRNLQFSVRSYDAEILEFQQGVRTSTEVLEASAAVGDAQAREISALRDYMNSRVDLAFATGTLLGMHAITWEPQPVPLTSSGPASRAQPSAGDIDAGSLRSPLGLRDYRPPVDDPAPR